MRCGHLRLNSSDRESSIGTPVETPKAPMHIVIFEAPEKSSRKSKRKALGRSTFEEEAGCSSSKASEISNLWVKTSSGD